MQHSNIEILYKSNGYRVVDDIDNKRFIIQKRNLFSWKDLESFAYSERGKKNYCGKKLAAYNFYKRYVTK